PAKHVGPGIVASDRRAQSAIAVGKAANLANRDTGSFCRASGCTRKRETWPWRVFKVGHALAGDADVDRGQGKRPDRRIFVLIDVGECHPGVAPLNGPLRRQGAWRLPGRATKETNRRRGTPPGWRLHRRQVSWLAGPSSLPPSRDLPVALVRARRLQLRGQP